MRRRSATSGRELTKLVASSSASKNHVDGIFVTGNGARVQSSTAPGNDLVGIRVDGDAPTLKNNHADGNGFPGGASDLTGLGIHVTSYTTAPTGSNEALGNDDPAECIPALAVLRTWSSTGQPGYPPGADP